MYITFTPIQNIFHQRKFMKHLGNTDDVRTAMRVATEEAKRHKQDFVRTGHLLLGLLRQDCPVWATLMLIGIDPAVILEAERVALEEANSYENPVDYPKLAPWFKMIFDNANREALDLGAEYVSPDHLLLGLLKEEAPASRLLKTHGVTLEAVRKAVAARMLTATRRIKDDMYIVDVAAGADIEAVLAAVRSLASKVAISSVIVMGDKTAKA